MAIVNYSNLHEIRNRHHDKKIVMCTGAFDIPHAGHALFLSESKNLGDILIVGIGQDKDIKAVKGEERPIIKEHLRLRMIDALRAVDYSFLHNSPYPPSDYLSPIREICAYLHPDMWAVNYDAAQMDGRIILAKELGVELKILNLNREHPDFEGLSTTQIIERIKRLEQKDQN